MSWTITASISWISYYQVKFGVDSAYIYSTIFFGVNFSSYMRARTHTHTLLLHTHTLHHTHTHTHVPSSHSAYEGWGEEEAFGQGNSGGEGGVPLVKTTAVWAPWRWSGATGRGVAGGETAGGIRERSGEQDGSIPSWVGNFISVSLHHTL